MKEIAVIFDRPIVLPGNGNVAVETFGFIFPQSELTKPENIITYTKHYVMVIAQLFQDKTIEFFGKLYFKKDGKKFYMDDDIWDEFDKKAEQSGVQFALLEIENTDVPNEERYEEYLLTSRERWEDLKSREDVVWEK
jgi:hypothetical protein